MNEIEYVIDDLVKRYSLNEILRTLANAVEWNDAGHRVEEKGADR